MDAERIELSIAACKAAVIPFNYAPILEPLQGHAPCSRHYQCRASLSKPKRHKMEPGVGLEPTWSFLAALQERCNRHYANPAKNGWDARIRT